jgi:hypothetical protein
MDAADVAFADLTVVDADFMTLPFRAGAGERVFAAAGFLAGAAGFGAPLDDFALAVLLGLLGLVFGLRLAIGFTGA